MIAFKKILSGAVAGSLLMTSVAFADAAGSADEKPNAAKIFIDLVVVRPVDLVLALAGGVVWVAALPVTLITDTVGESADTLVAEPATDMLFRCLGCSTMKAKDDPGFSFQQKNAAE